MGGETAFFQSWQTSPLEQKTRTCDSNMKWLWNNLLAQMGKKKKNQTHLICFLQTSCKLLPEDKPWLTDSMSTYSSKSRSSSHRCQYWAHGTNPTHALMRNLYQQPAVTTSMSSGNHVWMKAIKYQWISLFTFVFLQV